jgi:signal peptidase I
MKCPRCQLENIPGQERCLRCHSILEADGAVTEVNPPRMPAWRRPWRDCTRWLRGHRLRGRRFRAEDVPRGWTRAFAGPSVGLALNVLPGLGHLVRGRFREVRLLVLLWLLLVAAGAFAYGSNVGTALLSLAVAVHAWIAVRLDLIDRLGGFGERLMAVLGVMIVLALLYWGVPRMVFHDYMGIRTAMAIPGLRIQQGDYLLARRLAPASELFPRGTLVLVHPPTLINAYRSVFENRRNLAMGEIVGLPGESVRIQGGTFTVGSEHLDPLRFPVPAWLQHRSFSLRVPADSYFISAPYSATGRRNVTAEMVEEASVFEAREIRGRVFMRWWPLSRRGFIE